MKQHFKPNEKEKKGRATSPSQKWLDRLHLILEDKNTHNHTLDNKNLADRMETSERDLFRKVKEQTGLSPQKYLRQCRLRRAKYFLEVGVYRTVKDTSRAVHYSNVSYFIAQFEREFGKTPFQVLREEGWR